MPETGIRELKTRASEFVRRVRERKVRYIITYRGRPVAILGPVEGTPIMQAGASDASAWQDLERLGKTIGKGWRSRKTSADLLSETRR
jgi:prevent-host-death family protein